jgi:hypothetical protein
VPKDDVTVEPHWSLHVPSDGFAGEPGFTPFPHDTGTLSPI